MRKSLFLILGLVVIVVLLPLLTIMYMRRANTTPTYNQAIALLQRSGDAVIRSDPLTHTSTSIANLAFSCISLLEGSTQLQTVDPTRSQSFQTYGLSIANYLVTNDNLSPDGTIGWGLSNPFDAFSDGTVNPANTVYAFEDAMVGYCLLDAYTLTKNALYLKTVES
ncbi:MAG TPA: hypothetical protein VEP90_02900, partial [Methylomirabilota bacterium]|nr:hypothetical protein [Methylomirabilota bacterium]